MHGFHSTLLWQTLIRLCEGVEKHHNYNLSPSDCTKIGKLQLPYKSKTTIYSTLGLGPFSLCLSFALRLCCSFFRGNLLPLILTLTTISSISRGMFSFPCVFRCAFGLGLWPDILQVPAAGKGGKVGFIKWEIMAYGLTISNWKKYKEMNGLARLMMLFTRTSILMHLMKSVRSSPFFSSWVDLKHRW